jgi:hypothetical protein
MTREEVIDLLKKDKSQRGKCFVSDALDIAINVLEQEHTILEKIREEINQEAYNDISGLKIISVNRINQIIGKYKT